MDGLVYVGRTAVVSCDNEVPVVEEFVEITQVVSGCIRCLHWIAALVVEGIYLQAIAFSGGKHKLPETCGSYSGNGFRVKCRFYDRQVFQLQWQVVGFQCLFEDRHVEVAGAEHEAHGAAELAAIAVDEFLYHLVVWHFDEGRQSLQAVDIYLFFENRVHIAILA